MVYSLRNRRPRIKGSTSEWKEQHAPRVIPSSDMPIVHQFLQHSLRHDSTLEVESSIFGLTRLVNVESVTEPFIGLTSKDEFGRAEGVAKKGSQSQESFPTSVKKGTTTYEMFSNESHKQ